jgi:hypothetical protein
MSKNNFYEGWSITDMLPCDKHQDHYPECLVCVIEQRNKIIQDQQEIIESFLAVYDAQSSGDAFFANQGQSMDGYAALYNYNQLCSIIAGKE